MRNANLFLIGTMPSEQTATLYGENEKTKDQVWRLFRALHLSAAFRVFDTAFSLTGALDPWNSWRRLHQLA